MRNLKAVLFDLDDTLYDRKAAQIAFVGYIYRTFHDIFQNVELPETISAFLHANDISDTGDRNGAAWTRDDHSRYFLRSLGISEGHYASISEAYIEQTHTISTPVPDAVTVVKEVSRRFPTALLTNGYIDLQYNRLQHMEMESCFSCIVTGPEIGLAKPDPAIFKHTAALLGVDPGECLNIGDFYECDIIGAKNAGMQACWYNPEDEPIPDGTDIRPDFIIHSLTEILEIIENT